MSFTEKASAYAFAWDGFSARMTGFMTTPLFFYAIETLVLLVVLSHKWGGYRMSLMNGLQNLYIYLVDFLEQS